MQLAISLRRRHAMQSGDRRYTANYTHSYGRNVIIAHLTSKTIITHSARMQRLHFANHRARVTSRD